MTEYNIKVVKALNGWVVHCGGIYVVPEDGDLGGTVVAAITAERMEPTPKITKPKPDRTTITADSLVNLAAQFEAGAKF